MPIMEEVDETVEKIKKLEIQGARDIARESLKVIKKQVKEKGFGSEFEEAIDKLEHARPTGVSAHNCLKYLKQNREIETIDKLLNYLNRSNEWIGELGADLIKNNVEIMTHCHSETVMNILKTAKTQGKNFKVFVTETRPKLQGILTARELTKNNIPVYYVVDSASGLFMFSCEMVLVGSDAVKPDGIINKIGTYLIALAAREAEIPVYVAASRDKLDYDDVSVIEERPAREIINPEEIKGSKIDNPAFDLTPWKLVEGVITECGILNQNEVMDLISRGFEIES